MKGNGLFYGLTPPKGVHMNQIKAIVGGKALSKGVLPLMAIID